jgi:hypothetical protein
MTRRYDLHLPNGRGGLTSALVHANSAGGPRNPDNHVPFKDRRKGEYDFAHDPVFRDRRRNKPKVTLPKLSFLSGDEEVKCRS